MKKSVLKTTVLMMMMILAITSFTQAQQRVVKGIVYMKGEPASGVTVEAHKSSDSFFTGFDGAYEIKVDAKSKYIKFSFIDEVKKFDIEGSTETKVNFYWDGIKPAVEAEGGVILKTQEELLAANDKEFLQSYSLYNQFYKQKDYRSALPHWRKIYSTYPKCSRNIYLHGVNMYKSFIEKARKAGDIKTQDVYLDSVMTVYDQRVKYLNEEGTVVGKKAKDYLETKIKQQLDEDQLVPVMKKGYGLCEKSVKLQGNDTELAILVLYMQTTSRLFGLGEFPKEKVVENYETCVGIVEAVKAKDGESEATTKAMEIVQGIFEGSGAADCEALITLYTPKFNAHSNDIEMIKKMLRMLDKRDCDNSELYTLASEKLYQLEPSAEAAYNMAKMFYRKDEVAKAKEYYKQAIDNESDKALLAKYYYELALVILDKDKNYSAARANARKAIQNDPKYGKAYNLIGLIYTYAAKTFSDDDFKKNTLFWLAVDYFTKAKNVDPELAKEANNHIRTYSNYFPGNEETFMQGYKKGDTYKIEGWVNETTTVRTK